VADFVQTMKDWKRMCNSMGQENEYTACDKCDLRDFGCPAIYEKEGDNADWKRVENVVAKWAAEHPEPKYPTWLEWLHDLGLIVQREGTFTEYGPNEAFSAIKKVDILTIKGYQSIPADLAQKLGIEPKEE